MKAQINCTSPSRALTLSTLKLFRNKVTYEVMLFQNAALLVVKDCYIHIRIRLCLPSLILLGSVVDTGEGGEEERGGGGDTPAKLCRQSKLAR